MSSSGRLQSHLTFASASNLSKKGFIREFSIRPRQQMPDDFRISVDILGKKNPTKDWSATVTVLPVEIDPLREMNIR